MSLTSQLPSSGAYRFGSLPGRLMVGDWRWRVRVWELCLLGT